MKSLNKKDIIILGITLFSMFFGAGNLIFPPYLGNNAGENFIPAFLGFAVSAIGLPVLAVTAVTKSGGLNKLASRVHPAFSYIFIIILYLAIGPCLAIPRTASTSFEMAVLPFYEPQSILPSIIYSFIFFTVAVIIAQKPEKLTEYLGKKLTPCLITLITVIFLGTMFFAVSSIPVSSIAYKSNSLVKGFLDGYQTMDTLAALNFGIIISMNIMAKGIEEKKSVMKYTINAGWIAGILLFIIYLMLGLTGLFTTTNGLNMENGAQILTVSVSSIFGHTGLIILAIIFIIACLNTCIGLFSCCGKYFSDIFPKISYRKWVMIFAITSFFIANIGLTQILKYSVPILNILYPTSIVLIVLALINNKIRNLKFIYPITIYVCILFSVLIVFNQNGINIPLSNIIISKMPLYKIGFGWVVPTLIAFILSCLLNKIINKNLKQ